MITDRTLEDVENAKAYREKLGRGEMLTVDEINTLERGTITISTLNRIEDKERELAGALAGEKYLNISFENKNWGYNDIFLFSDFVRILKNIEILRNNFYFFKTTPDVPAPKYYYTNINDIEQNLVDIQEIYIDMKTRYKRCGTFSCGEA
jgi:hypothetical protein